MLNKILFIFSVILLIPFIYIISINAYSKNTHIDIIVWDYVREYRNGTNTLFFSYITHLADAWFLVIVTLIIVFRLLIKKNIILAAWLGTSALSGAWLMNKYMKEYFIRPRPFTSGYIDNLAHASGYSFPSGHAMGAIICYILMAYVYSRYSRSIFMKLIVYLGAIVLSLIIATSRVYLGVHYPTDVIAGFSFGFSIVLIFIIIYRGIAKLGNRKG